MTISSTINRNDYIGNGATATYSYTFRILSSSDLKVITRDTNNVESVLTLGTGYTVSGVGNTNGGSITLTAGNLATGYSLTIRRIRPLTQGTDIRNQGDFFPNIHEDAFDDLTMKDQTQQVDLDRSLKLPETVTGVSGILPVPVALKWPRWNAAGTALENVDATNLGSITTIGSGLLLSNGNLSANPSEWIKQTGPFTYVSATQFTVSGNFTSTFQKGRRLQAIVTAGTVYGTVTATSYAAGITTVTTIFDTGALDSGLSAISVGVLAVISSSYPLTFAIDVRVFGAMGDGVTDDTVAISNAINAAYALKVALYFAANTYLISANKIMGNTVAQASTYMRFFGDGNNTIIKCITAGVNPFLWQGPNPDVDGTGNRIDGRILIEKMAFYGPGFYGYAKSGIGIKFYGAQGIILRDMTFKGWDTGEYYQNVDIVSRYNVVDTLNNKGIDTNATGYALPSGKINSFNSYGGLINNNTTFGINYYGGIAPGFFGTNFVANGNSLIFSNITGAAGVTVCPVISGCYFEGDTGNILVLGGGTNIVRGIKVDGGNMLVTQNSTAIKVNNYSNVGAATRGIVSIGMEVAGGVGSFTAIDQSSSVEKVDTDFTMNNVAIGGVTPSTGMFTTIGGQTITYAGLASGNYIGLFAGPAGGYSNPVTGILSVNSTSAGRAEFTMYSVNINGNGTVGGIRIIGHSTYGTPSPHALYEVAASPAAGQNALYLKNTDTQASNYTINLLLFQGSSAATILTPNPTIGMPVGYLAVNGQSAETFTLGGITTPGGAVFHTTSTALTNGAGAGAGTISNAPAAGNPTKWIGINDNGVTRYIPAW